MINNFYKSLINISLIYLVLSNSSKIFEKCFQENVFKESKRYVFLNETICISLLKTAGTVV